MNSLELIRRLAASPAVRAAVAPALTTSFPFLASVTRAAKPGLAMPDLPTEEQRTQDLREAIERNVEELECLDRIKETEERHSESPLPTQKGA